MTLRGGLLALARAVAIPIGVAASLGIVDALRSLPGPGLALALPLRETGHQDRASVFLVTGAFVLVSGLIALVLGPSHARPLRTALVGTAAVLGCVLALQAASLQLVRQASLGLDWGGALRSPAPFVCALGALLGIAAACAASSDRRMRSGRAERPVEGRSGTAPLAKIVP